MRIVGGDLSLRNTGLVFKAPVVGEQSTIEATVITAGQHLEGAKRIFEVGTKVHQHIIGFLMASRTEQKLVVLEGYAFSRQQAVAQAELGGFLKAQLYISGYAPIIVQPLTLHKFVTGSGRAGKEEVAQGVRKRWGYDPEPFDQNLVDAYALAQFGWAYLCPALNQWTAFQREVIERYCNPPKKRKRKVT